MPLTKTERISRLVGRIRAADDVLRHVWDDIGWCSDTRPIAETIRLAQDLLVQARGELMRVKRNKK